MKAFRIAAFAALAVLYAAQVHAQSTPPNDPVIRTGGGSHSVGVTSPIFKVVSPSGNSPALNTLSGSTDCVLAQPGKAPTTVPGCFFKNNIMLPGGTGVTITRLIFIVDSDEFSGILTCGTDTALGGTGPFAACSVQPVGDGTLSVVSFFNGSVPPGSDFSMGMRGFNSNPGFPGIALFSKNSVSTEIYELTDPARLHSALHRVVNYAPRSLGCETCQLRTLSDFQRDRRPLGSFAVAADADRTVQCSARSSSNRPNSDGMPGPSPITFEAWPASGRMWRIT